MPHVVNNRERSRFEMPLDGGVAYAVYREAGDRLIVTHTETPAALRGRGHGEALVKGMLDCIRAEGRRITPRCGFVAAYMRRHPETQDLLA